MLPPCLLHVNSSGTRRALPVANAAVESNFPFEHECLPLNSITWKRCLYYASRWPAVTAWPSINVHFASANWLRPQDTYGCYECFISSLISLFFPFVSVGVLSFAVLRVPGLVFHLSCSFLFVPSIGFDAKGSAGSITI